MMKIYKYIFAYTSWEFYFHLGQWENLIFNSTVETLKSTYIWWLNHLSIYVNMLSLIFVSSRSTHIHYLTQLLSLPVRVRWLSFMLHETHVLHLSSLPKALYLSITESPWPFLSKLPFLKVCIVSTQKRKLFWTFPWGSAVLYI